jgi:hypothetical protein
MDPTHPEQAMPSVFDSVTEQLSGSNLTQLSRQIGADEATTSQAVQAALPMLLGGLARNASSPDGAVSLGNALNDHRGGLMENLGGLLGNAESGAGAGILGHIFGQKRETVETGVGQATGLKQQQVGKLLMVLAPIVMAALARRQQAQQEQQVPLPGSATPAPSEASGLPDIVQREAQEAQQRAPTGLGGLLGMLDRDGDGNPLNDIGRMAGGSGLGGLFGR